MKLFIWQGNRIGHGWHNDASLVVLAETAEQAREIARQPVDPEDVIGAESNYGPALTYWKDRWFSDYEDVVHIDESIDEAINREPDRVVELDKPAFVLFNGGGYD